MAYEDRIPDQPRGLFFGISETLSRSASFYVVFVLMVTSSVGADSVTTRINESLSEIPIDMPLSSTTIYLSYNNISLCPHYSFGVFPKLTILYLDHNVLRAIESEAFNGTGIEELHLDHNELGSVPNLTGIGSTLKILDLSSNALTAFTMADLLSMTSLEQLRLSGNPLIEFNVSDTLILDGLLTHHNHCLEYLYLNDIATDVVTNADFSGLPCLSELFLIRTGLTSFEQIQNIRILNETLCKLNLQDNGILTVPEEWLHHLGTLTELQLENNRIRTLDEIMDSLESSKRVGFLMYIYVYNNPIVCNCNWSWLLGNPCVGVDDTRDKILCMPKGVILSINKHLCQLGGPQFMENYTWSNMTEELLCPPTTTGDYISTISTLPLTTTRVTTTATTPTPKTTPTTTAITQKAAISTTDKPPISSSPYPHTDIETTQESMTSSLDTPTIKPDEDVIQLSWNTWISWSECSSRCGGGYQYSLKVCDVINPSANCSTPLKRGEEVVLYYSVSQQTCNTQKCPIDGYWVTWSNWTTCSATCGTGTKTRIRDCVEPKYGGEECDGLHQENNVCILDDCVEKRVRPVDLHDGQYYLESDRRQSAVNIGAIAMILLGIELAIVLVLDVHTIAMACKRLQRRQCWRSCRKMTKLLGSEVHPSLSTD